MLGKIDLNCDMGEGFANDALIMPLISSANIACGFHAGGGALMHQTIRLAMQHHVAIGAHPSFNDREGFGRRILQLPTTAIHRMVSDQIDLMMKATAAEGGKLSHVKPHGALYNMAANELPVADAISRAIQEIDDTLIVYGLPDSASESSAKAHGLRFYKEVFSDRTYTNEGKLTPREEPHAMIETAVQSLEQVLKVILHETIKSTGGHEISVKADTICIHGDGEHALAFAQLINTTLVKHGIAIKQ